MYNAEVVASVDGKRSALTAMLALEPRLAAGRAAASSLDLFTMFALGGGNFTFLAAVSKLLLK